jgi:hypothetical protein
MQLRIREDVEAQADEETEEGEERESEGERMTGQA